MTRLAVADVEEIGEGSRKLINIEGRAIGIFNVNGEYFAVRNECPHAGAPLCVGRTEGYASSGGPGQVSYARRGEILRCPWHGWEFDLRTGRSCWDPERTRVRTYPTLVLSGAELGGNAATVAPDRGTGQNADTPDEPVLIHPEHRYVVIDM